MINLIQACLRNRFPDGSRFALSDGDAQLRQKLCLDRSGDYYVRSYLANLHSWPDIWHNLPGHERETFDPARIRRPRVVSDGCEFLADERGVSSFEEHQLVQRLPVSIDWTLRWQNTGNGIFRDELTGQQETVRVLATSEVLRVAWPLWSPFAGPLRLQIPWQEGLSPVYAFRVEPAAFPWAPAVERLKGDLTLSDWLARAGLVDEYLGAGDARLKVAVATALLVLNHPVHRA